MGKNWSYVSGDWWIICDVCSQKVKASKTRERWDGFRVCKGCWEPRHSLDFIRARNDRISVPFSRPQPADQFASTSYVTIYIDEGYFEYTGAGSGKQTYFEETL